MIFRIGLTALFLSGAASVADAAPANTLSELWRALGTCWIWPPLENVVEGMEITVRFSVTRGGEVFGEPRFTFFKPGVAPQALEAYQKAAAQSLVACTPLSITPEFGNVIAGRPIAWRFTETRKQRKA